MIPLILQPGPDAPMSVLAVGAHPDDVEIGAGGTLLTLAARHPGLAVRYVLMTGSPERQREARDAARLFTPGARLSVELHSLPDGRLPAAYEQVKEILETIASTFRPRLILAPSPCDAHQDHRTVGELIPTVFRDHLTLAYEIPKWDGDMRRPNAYIRLPGETMRRKTELLDKCYPSQSGRDWWGEDTFLALARLRGMECRGLYAEAFTIPKFLIA